MILRSDSLIMNFLVLFLILFIGKGHSLCYFPGELQGIWATQAPDSTNAPKDLNLTLSFQYYLVNITHDSISNWGHCYQRVYDNLILAHRTSDTYRCFRCFHLAIASVNVISIVSSTNNDCHSTIEDAVYSCPTHNQLASRVVTEMMLYKMQSAWGEPGDTPTECPINGVYTFTYDRGLDRREIFNPSWRSDDRRYNNIKTYTCEHNTSELSNCPYGYGLTVKYRDCSFSSQSGMITYLKCLGSWKGADGRKYFAVRDTSVTNNDNRPKYKCGIYHEEAGTGRVYMAFSRDSTCTSQLVSHREGFERYVLTSVPASPLPPDVTNSECRFPESLYGHWHNTYIDKSTVVFKDYNNMTTYSASCVQTIKEDEEKFIVYAISHCLKGSYNCLWLKRRTANILEFMLGLTPSETFRSDLCDQERFGDETLWTTQPKSLLEMPTVCPIVGYYEGELPSAPGFCAQLYSDCDKPSRMFHAVNECRNSSAIFEQREYQCLGEWRDSDNIIYALTYRRDIHTYECFVGHIDGDNIYIKEAGETCKRRLNPKIQGMKLKKVQPSGPCKSQPEYNSILPERSVGLADKVPTKPPWVPTGRPTIPWKLITGPSRPQVASSSNQGLPSILSLILLLILRIYS